MAAVTSCESSPLSTFLKMADVLMLLPELIEDDVNVINDIIEDDDDIVEQKQSEPI